MFCLSSCLSGFIFLFLLLFFLENILLGCCSVLGCYSLRKIILLQMFYSGGHQLNLHQHMPLKIDSNSTFFPFHFSFHFFHFPFTFFPFSLSHFCSLLLFSPLEIFERYSSCKRCFLKKLISLGILQVSLFLRRHFNKNLAIRILHM